MNPIEDSDSLRLELLAGRVLGDLNEGEEQKLEVIGSSNSNDDLQELHQTATAVQLALLGATRELPESLKNGILNDAPHYLTRSSEQSHLKPPREGVPFSRASGDSTEIVDVQPAPSQKSLFKLPFHAREAFAWLSFAAAITLATGLWLYNRPDGSPLTNVALRSQLMDSAVDLRQVSWTAGPTAFETPVTGDVVWSNSLQAGFMRFVGMPTNDVTVEQYQLWIIDPDRAEEPIDGGVFDIASTGEVIIPIDAKLKVLNPKAFAITIEQPGGVVVSKQDRLPLLASL